MKQFEPVYLSGLVVERTGSSGSISDFLEWLFPCDGCWAAAACRSSGLPAALPAVAAHVFAAQDGQLVAPADGTVPALTQTAGGDGQHNNTLLFVDRVSRRPSGVMTPGDRRPAVSRVILCTVAADVGWSGSALMMACFDLG
ncbi:MAG: hypothetical protein JXB07_04405 [Anaerolineae bacterium]|nr:hypothetical protein [Anaerolineae bacterium]